jgi:hypothetical protein
MGWLGTVPDWLAAVAAIGALTTTVIVILRDRRDRVEYQARRLSVWSELDRSVPDDQKLDMNRHYYVYVRNSSESPVFDGLVKAVGSKGNHYYLLLVVPAHETVDYRLPEEFRLPEGFRAEEHQPPEVEIIFRDAARRYWRIARDGILHPASPHNRRIPRKPTGAQTLT